MEVVVHGTGFQPVKKNKKRLPTGFYRRDARATVRDILFTVTDERMKRRN